MRYFGFDLGDGESCVALYSDQHLSPIILPIHGRNSFITALARYDGHPVVGALASDNPQAEDLRVCFKRNFRTNTDFVNQTVGLGRERPHALCVPADERGAAECPHRAGIAGGVPVRVDGGGR